MRNMQQLLFGIAVVVITGLAARVAHGLEVQGCFGGAILTDPALCRAEDRIDAISMNFSATAPPPQGTEIHPGHSLFLLTKRIDRSSPNLFLNLVRGVSLQSLVVVIFEGGAGSARGRRLFSILLTEVTIASLEQSAQDSSLTSVIPTEVVGFRYVKIRLRDDLTGASSCFDFGQNASVNC